MPFDEGLAERIRTFLQDRQDIKEKKMFGGLCFMASRHMCCGIVDDRLMARVGPDSYENCLSKPHVREMDFTGKPMKGMVFVEPDGFSEDKDLLFWLEICLQFTDSLPPKK